jgi:phosphopantothenoylcysteine decarboxylase/phosphopantothenate--cysteine ligase
VTSAAIRADVVIMAAAVADYTPAHPADEKVAKTDGPLTITLERTPDILAELGRMASRASSGVPILVGFAAETGHAAAKARDKRLRKGIDLIVANDVGRADAGFDVPTNAVTIIGADGERELPVQSKERVASAILERVEQIIRSRTTAPTRA